MKTEPSQSFEQLLKTGSSILGLGTGIVSQIENNIYRVVARTSTEIRLWPGDEFELSDTYCADTVKSGKTTYYNDVAEIVEMQKHPVYLALQLRAYIGTPILVDGKVWGTLNFSSLEPRKKSYSGEEIRFLEEQAAGIAETVTSSNLDPLARLMPHG